MGVGTPVADPRPIGVFDSGTGGLSVLRALRAALPHEHFVYLDDSGHGPYGERSAAFVAERSFAITRLLRARGIKALVVACNTATAAAADAVRAAHADLPVVGVEPALKPAAALSQTRRVGVIATRGTLDSARFARLRAAVDQGVQCVLQPCDGLAVAIDALAERPTDAAVSATVERLCHRYLGAMGAFGTQPGTIDTLVLGCTHYVLVQSLLQSIAGPQVRLIGTGDAVARQTAARLGLATVAPEEAAQAWGPLDLLTTGEPERLARAARHWLHLDQATAARATA